jgi:hypothetical protein
MTDAMYGRMEDLREIAEAPCETYAELACRDEYVYLAGRLGIPVCEMSVEYSGGERISFWAVGQSAGTDPCEICGADDDIWGFRWNLPSREKMEMVLCRSDAERSDLI